MTPRRNPRLEHCQPTIGRPFHPQPDQRHPKHPWPRGPCRGAPPPSAPAATAASIRNRRHQRRWPSVHIVAGGLAARQGFHAQGPTMAHGAAKQWSLAANRAFRHPPTGVQGPWTVLNAKCPLKKGPQSAILWANQRQCPDNPAFSGRGQLPASLVSTEHSCGFSRSPCRQRTGRWPSPSNQPTPRDADSLLCRRRVSPDKANTPVEPSQVLLPLGDVRLTRQRQRRGRGSRLAAGNGPWSLRWWPRSGNRTCLRA